MTLRTMPAWLALAAALTALPAMAADMPAGYGGQGYSGQGYSGQGYSGQGYSAGGGAGFVAGWRAPPPPPPVAVEAEAEVIVAAPPPRRLLGFGYAPVLPYYGVSTGPYGYPPRPQPGVGVGLF